MYIEVYGAKVCKDDFIDGEVSIDDIFTGTGSNSDDAGFALRQRRFAMCLTAFYFVLVLSAQIYSGYQIAQLIEQMVISTRGSEGSSLQ